MLKYSFLGIDGREVRLVNDEDATFDTIKKLCDENDVKYVVLNIPDEPELGDYLLIAIEDPYGGECGLLITYDRLGYSEDRPFILFKHNLDDVIENHIVIDDEAEVKERSSGSNLLQRDIAYDICSMINDETAIDRMTAANIGPVPFPTICVYPLERFLKGNGIMYTKFSSDDTLKPAYTCLCIGVSEAEDKSKQTIAMELCFIDDFAMTSFNISRRSISKDSYRYDSNVFNKVETFEGKPLELAVANDILGRHLVNSFYEELSLVRVISRLNNDEYSSTLITNRLTNTNTLIIELDNDMCAVMEYKYSAIDYGHNNPLMGLSSFRFITDFDANELHECNNKFIMVDHNDGKKANISVLNSLSLDSSLRYHVFDNNKVKIE